MLITGNGITVFLFYKRNEKNVAVNKQFWRTIKLVLSDKVKSAEKIILVEEDKIINEDGRNDMVLTISFLMLLRI